MNSPLLCHPTLNHGVLSTINSLYDPLGVAAPVIIRGKLLLRDMLSSSNFDWDDPLPDSTKTQWNLWVHCVKQLELIRVPRPYNGISFSGSVKREAHIFGDASKDAIGAVAYLKLFNCNAPNVSFLLGKAKVAPLHGHTIPRLELCAAVLAVELSDIVRDHLELDPKNFLFYTDSRVVLGYLSNESRRFYVYVGNRVSRIRASSTPSQWFYVPSEQNPADLATRSIDPADLTNSSWISGPNMLTSNESPCYQSHTLIDPDSDCEIRPYVDCTKTEVYTECDKHSLGSQRFERFSEWTSLVRGISRLKSVIRKKSRKDMSLELTKDSETMILLTVQQEIFHEEFKSLKEGKCVPPRSSLASLALIIDSDGILRVGGRLKHAPSNEMLDMSKHPVILPKKHHITSLIVDYFHRKIHHQGRHMTEGAIRAGGFWIVGAKRLISSMISKCLTCRKLRGKLEWQQMADLPEVRLTPCPPFSYVGVDTFGPWHVAFRKTRGGSANQKRWALLFTCLTTRAVHIEVTEELSTSSFINALRRVIAVRGPIAQFRSDRGTHFVGATSELNITPEYVENGPVKEFLRDSNITWKFNPPYAHHMGGPCERLIGVARRILDGILVKNKGRTITHEILVTFMAEVLAIINNRPLVPVSSYPDCPSILIPSTLLTMKTNTDVKPFPSFSIKDCLRSHWKYVQGLADEFWRRWRNEYLNELQIRSKWQNYRGNLQTGDLVLVKDQESPRNSWPIGLIERIFPSTDGKIRKVEVAIIKDGKRMPYVRSVSELVTLLEIDT